MRNTTLVYIEKNNCFLMLLRNKKQVDENKGKWIGVGGKFEEGESPEDCLLREVKEETGLTLTAYQYRAVITFVSDEWGTEYMHLFTASSFEGELKVCEEGELKWIPKDRIMELNLWEGDRKFLPMIFEEGPFFTMRLQYKGDDLTQVKTELYPLGQKTAKYPAGLDINKETDPVIYRRETDPATCRKDPASELQVRQAYEKLTMALIAKGLTITTMESITAGAIASLITDTEGSSAVLKGAFVTYSNEAKVLQGVPKEIIDRYSVYSKETALAMASTCRRAYDANIGIGVTGTAGNVDPANPEASMPGTVYYAIECNGEAKAYEVSIPPQSSRAAYKLVIAGQICENILRLLEN